MSKSYLLTGTKLVLLLSAAFLMHPLTSSAASQVVDCTITSESESDSHQNCASYLEQNESRWQFGISLGYGERSNPLINSDKVPIYGSLQLSYTGETFFFDNGDFGIFLDQGEHWDLNLIAGVGGERSFFSFLNTGSFLFDPTSSEGGFGGGPDSDPASGIPPEAEPNEDGSLSVDLEAPRREYTVDGGLELFYDLGRSSVQVQALTDLSGRHKGQELWAAWSIPISQGRWHLRPSLGFTWKSSANANYFYGVKKDEAQPGLPSYRAGSAFNPFARLSARYRINDHWSLVGVLHYESLDDEIGNSPSVEDDHVSTGFIGVYYAF